MTVSALGIFSIVLNTSKLMYFLAFLAIKRQRTNCGNNATFFTVRLRRKHIISFLAEIRSKADQFSGALSTEALAGAQITDGLQQIGLALGVFSHDQVDAGLKIQGNFAVIAKIPKLQALKPHGRRSGKRCP